MRKEGSEGEGEGGKEGKREGEGERGKEKKGEGKGGGGTKLNQKGYVLGIFPFYLSLSLPSTYISTPPSLFIFLSLFSAAGCCCIDEFDKMGSQHQALLEAMVTIHLVSFPGSAWFPYSHFPYCKS